jgi:hypothetical protein
VTALQPSFSLIQYAVCLAELSASVIILSDILHLGQTFGQKLWNYTN